MSQLGHFRRRAASQPSPLIPQQRTCGDCTGMSVSCQVPTSAWMGIPSNPSYNTIEVGLRAMVQERPVRVERKLSAIMAADVAGYSRLMHNDEEATHARLTTLLRAAVAPAIAEYGGRIVKNTGGRVLGGLSERGRSGSSCYAVPSPHQGTHK
jgi:hypothetical protein